MYLSYLIFYYGVCSGIMKCLKYLKNLFLSLKDIFIILGIELMVLFSIVTILGKEKSILIGTIFVMIYFSCLSLFMLRKEKFSIRNTSYFPYMLIGISIAVIFNMIIFRMGIMSEINVDISTFIVILSSGIISPTFEEVLFRYYFINKLEKFNSNKWVIILLSGVIFGLIHNGIVTVIYGTIVGLVNAYLYVKHKNILIPIIVHASGNIIVNFLTGYNLWILILGIILLILSIILIKKNNSSK